VILRRDMYSIHLYMDGHMQEIKAHRTTIKLVYNQFSENKISSGCYTNGCHTSCKRPTSIKELIQGGVALKRVSCVQLQYDTKCFHNYFNVTDF
jgi:hypothetical protein